MIQSIARAFDILQVLEEAGDDGISLGQVARYTELKNPTAHNILDTLCKLGYVQQIEGNHFYQLSDTMAELGRNQYVDRHLRQVAQMPVQKLCDQLNETAVLTVYRQHKRHSLLTIESSQALRVCANRQCVDQAFYSTATGRVLLSLLNSQELKDLCGLLQFSEQEWPEVRDKKSLVSELELIRTDGFVVIRKPGQHVHAAAVPVLVQENLLYAALGVYYPSVRSSAEREKEMVEGLKLAAQEIAIQYEAKVK